jgi:hypothetical protein
MGFAVEPAINREVTDNLYLGTFLKGHFVKTKSHGYCWTILPSRILKSGCFKSNPEGYMNRYCQKISRQEGVTVFEIKCRVFQHAWACAVLPYKSLPIFREFYALFYDPLFSTDDVTVINDTIVEISKHHLTIEFDAEEWMKFIDYRYKIDRSVIMDLIGTMKLLKLGQFLIHPAFSKFIMVDY